MGLCVVVHVAGDTLLKGRKAMYKIDANERTLKASSTALPTVLKAIGRNRGEEADPSNVALVLVLPHSLISLASILDPELGSVGSSKSWVKRATKALRIGFVDRLFEDALSGGTEDKQIIEQLEEMREREGMIKTLVVQIKGSFSLVDSSIRTLKMNGSPSHAFAEVYMALKELGERDDIEAIYFDLSQGWNHLTFSAFMGALAYADVGDEGIEVVPISSLPFSIPRRGGLGKSNSRKESEKKAGNELPMIDFIDLGEIYLLHELMGTISDLFPDRGRLVDPSIIDGVWKEIVEEYGRYGDIEKGKILLKSLLHLRKLSCALSTGVLPYIHLAGREFKEGLPQLMELEREVREKISNGEYVNRIEVKLDEKTSTLTVEYELSPPLSYPIIDSLLRAAERLKISDGPLAKHLDRNYMPLSLGIDLYELYGKLGMRTNQALLATELALLDDQGEVKQSVDDIVKEVEERKKVKERTGVAIGYMYEYINEMKRYIEKRGEVGIKEEVVEKRDGYPLYWLKNKGCNKIDEYLKPGVNSDLMKKVHEFKGDWSEAMDRIVSDLENCKKAWAKTFLRAWHLMQGQDEDVTPLMRNLYAHVGLQHFSVKNVLPELREGEIEEVRIYYYRKLFSKLDSMASDSMKDKAPNIPEELKEEVGSICDMRTGRR